MEKEKNTKKVKKLLKEIIPYILIIISILLIKKYVFTTVLVNGDSMNNTLKNKDLMILNKIEYHLKGIKRFDIIVANVSNTKLIKRIIGMPGDYIEYQNNELYINGEKVDDPYGNGTTYDFDLKSLEIDKIPANYYFVLGDNREDSIDSRMIGLVSKDDILGHASFILFPLNRFGSV
ncbi:MAG: signal peptidase I [bacterium]|nr:signal peptidase I [bacterium]